MVLVIAVVADLSFVADPVAPVGNVAGNWPESLSPSPNSCQAPRPLETTPLPVSACQSHTMFRPPAQDALRPGSGVGVENSDWWKAQFSQGNNQPLNPNLARDALRPGLGSATGKPDGDWRKTQYSQCESCRAISEWWEREKKRNVVGPAGAPSASGPVGTASQWQASGLLLS
jgi:hypothetical protein